MITHFEAFYTDLFDRENIIDSRFQVFLRNLIASLTANNPAGVFTTLITNITADYNTYFGNFETKGVNIAERKGSTSSLDGVSRLFVTTVRSKYSLIESVYPKGSSVYIEFFPKGLTEFSSISRADIQSISHRMAVKATEYMATLGGAPFAAIFTTFETNITAALGTQNTGKSVVKTITSEVITNRSPVEDQTMKAMYAVGLQFWPNQATCRSYFDFSLLFGVASHPSVVESGVATALSNTLCIGTGIVATSVFTLKNKSDFPLTFFGAHTADGPVDGRSFTIQPHDQNVCAFTEFGAADILFLYVTNATAFAGNWEVRMD